MCDFSKTLVAWMDGELPPEESAELERHLKSCAECRGDAEACRRVSGEFEAFCEAQFSSAARSKSLHWIAAASAAGAIAALMALFLVWPRTHVQPRSLEFPKAGPDSSAVVTERPAPKPAVSVKSIHPKLAASRVRTRAKPPQAIAMRDPGPDSYFGSQNEPVVQIAISGDEMFPPGALPPGMNFVADVAIAADGSADRVQLRPRLAGFERSSIQP
ncbi:MAG TPA: zf-HC2 domain-containing protein [Candidatus Acidoferrales bacterium]|nr:zf-HC2 domain-containing protein [Candidatus Acidoferrales bacterium]